MFHNGLALFPGAVGVLEKLAGGPVILLSNAPRRAASVQSTLDGLGLSRGLYRAILTSGEQTHVLLRDRPDAWFAALATRAFHIGPARDRGIIDDLPITRVESPAEASFVLNTGPDDEGAVVGVEPFLPMLRDCLQHGLPMLCANPDLEVVRGTTRLICAGALAASYEAMAGDVRHVGKPDPAIFYAARDLAASGPQSRVLVIGDSLRTDIAGAQAAGFDSLWVLTGIHAQGDEPDPQSAAREDLARAGISPTFLTSRLAW